MLKANVLWDDVHLTAHVIAIEGLLNLGILKGDKEEILKARTSAAFFPHGLGHYLGMDTHDTGGHPDYEDKDRLYRYLRVRGRVPEGSIVTVEPGVCLSFSFYFPTFSLLLPSFPLFPHSGLSQHHLTNITQIYFCDFIIEPYLTDPAHSKFIDQDVLKSYWAVGGVRIEDNILITKDGYENLTTVPKEIEDMEKLINGA